MLAFMETTKDLHPKTDIHLKNYEAFTLGALLITPFRKESLSNVLHGMMQKT